MTYFQSQSKDFTLYQDDCLEKMDSLPASSVNMILTIKRGKVQSVNKGDWDKSLGDAKELQFTHDWLSKARNLLTDDGTIWVSGTHHNIFTIGLILPKLGFKVLDMVTWESYFTHSTEFIIWARKNEKVPHCYNYDLMKKLNGDKQMKDVWRLPAVAKWERECGKHPTQNPLTLLAQIILASTKQGDLVLDPFSGSATTGIAACALQRNYIGIEQDAQFLELSKQRYEDLKQGNTLHKFYQQFNRNEEKVFEGLLDSSL